MLKDALSVTRLPDESAKFSGSIVIGASMLPFRALAGGHRERLETAFRLVIGGVCSYCPERVNGVVIMGVGLGTDGDLGPESIASSSAREAIPERVGRPPWQLISTPENWFTG